MEVEHFSHSVHPLILINQVLEYSGELVICSGCDEPIWGPCYSCTSCYFFLHKKCAELPHLIFISNVLFNSVFLKMMAHQFAHIDHSLISNEEQEFHVEGSFVYRCSFCNFNLDIKCALPPCLLEVEGQEHQFICLPKSLPLKIVSFTCNACGTDGDDSPFVCTMCQLIVHKTCISNKYCGICRDGVDTDYGVYYCQDCDFVAHVICGIQYRLSNTESDGDERSITMNDEFKESSFDVVREIKHGDERIIAEIKHFSHQHNLILIDEFNNDPKCDGCMLPIFTPFYSCTECNFSLDKACIGLPRKKYWQYDRHPLILILNTWEEDPFQCAICEQYCYGFSYNCDRCHRFLDVRCFKLTKDSIEHGGHEHPLYLANGRNATTFTGRNDHSLSSVDFEPDELHDDGEAKQKDNALRLALTQLAGEFGRESMLSLQRFFNSRRAPVISTGSLKLDLALGIGGLPKV
ncbi:LOW QUALITY PROTEIN: hypothetical protein NC651_035182 [Populus alba x Populus x berolinensis]|nr:LOW QUALITY PROTEIN: hypothetical protein NC651_035182 [Populus alba x Populus x berolinensis]